MNNLEVLHELDWPEHINKRDFNELDEAARCSICHDFFNTPLSLHCGHSFCSDCIRTNIQFQERTSGKTCCPQCRHPADSRHIFANHPLRDLVRQFLRARPHLIAAAAGSIDTTTAAGPGATSKETRAAALPAQRRAKRTGKRGKASSDAKEDQAEAVIDLGSESDLEASGRQLRKRHKSVEYYPEPESDDEANEDENEVDESDGSEDSLSSPSPSPKKRRWSVGKQKSEPREPGKLPKNWGECPCCHQNFPLGILNDHLDRCLESGGTMAEPARNGVVAKGSKKPKLVVPPKLLLAIEKDKSLRDRLKKFGLPTKGSRQELEQRYTRFRVEVQTALDRCETAATYESLARRVTSRESSESNATANGHGMRVGPARPVASSGFDDLIKATRQRAAAKAPEPAQIEEATRAAESDVAGGCDEPADATAEPRATDQETGEQQAIGQADGPLTAREEQVDPSPRWGRGFRRQPAGYDARQIETQLPLCSQVPPREVASDSNGACQRQYPRQGSCAGPHGTANGDLGQNSDLSKMEPCSKVDDCSHVQQREISGTVAKQHRVPWSEERAPLQARLGALDHCDVVEDSEEDDKSY